MSKFSTHRNLKIDATFTIGTEAADVINVGIQLTDRDNGNEISERVAVMYYLADDVAGDTPSGTAPDGGIAIGTDGALTEWTANVSGLAISESDGDLDIDVTESATPTFYLILVMPDGKLQASAAITFA